MVALENVTPAFRSIARLVLFNSMYFTLHNQNVPVTVPQKQIFKNLFSKRASRTTPAGYRVKGGSRHSCTGENINQNQVSCIIIGSYVNFLVYRGCQLLCPPPGNSVHKTVGSKARPIKRQHTRARSGTDGYLALRRGLYDATSNYDQCRLE